MNNELQHYGLNGVQHQGLNGFFKRLWSGVKDVVEFASSLGVPFAGAILSGMNVVDGGTCRIDPLFTCRSVVPQSSEEVLLTDVEFTTLKFWIDNQFTPFYMAMIKSIDEALKSDSLEQQLIVINDVVAKMVFFKAYLSTNPDKLSINALSEQMAGVTEHFAYIEKALQDIIVSSGIQFVNNQEKRTSQGLDFQPFQLPVMTLVVDRYTAGNTGIVMIDQTGTPIVLPTEEEAVILTDEQTTPKPERTKTGSNLILWVLGGFIGYRILK